MKKTSKIVTVVLSLTILFSMFMGLKRNYVKAKVNSFKENYSQKNYEEARKIFNEEKDDSFNKLFKFNNSIISFLEDQLKDSKEKVLSCNEDLNSIKIMIEDMKKYDGINKDSLNDLSMEISKVEESMKFYNEAKGYLEKEDYKKSLETVNKSISSFEENKDAWNLKADILEKFKNYVLTGSENFVKDGNYTKALALLEENKEFLDKDEIDNKISEVKDLATKQQEEKKNRMIEQAKKEDARYVSLLSSYKHNPEKEDFINSVGLNSGSKFLIWVDLNKQETNVFLKALGKWNIIKELSSSTGISGKDTPKGTYRVTGRGDWFFSDKYDQGAKYWVQFYGNYLFHSLPMDMNRNIVDYTLGKPASHGCVRLEVEEAKWIYNNIPNGTTVYIK